MSRITAVIGANYGDEGKGRVVNYLSDAETVVARFSGSAQAAHTVLEKGQRHVFKHFGSGAMREATTFLGESFLCHPLMYMIEKAQLSALGHDPQVLVDWRSPVVLPTDMIINQALEKMRGDSRHGSCGMGVRQALERQTTPVLRLSVGDLDYSVSSGRLRHLMEQHLRVWSGMNGYHVDAILELAGVREFGKLCDRFSLDATQFLEDVDIRDNETWIADTLYDENLIMEGSQGLALDPGCGQLPHLTPSHVGVGGLVSFFSSSEIYPEDIELMYVTRPYLTRHGAGPLPREGEWELPVTDETNEPNEWQGTLRFAPLGFQEMLSRVRKDFRWMSLWPGGMPRVNFSLAVTCLDQVENTDFPFYNLRGERRRGLTEFLNECGRCMEAIAQGGVEGRLITCYGEDPVDTFDSGEMREDYAQQTERATA